MECQEDHRYDELFEDLPNDQGGAGRHKCPGCAYEYGLNDGMARKEQINLNLDGLNDSQAGTGRHKSPHAAYFKGYLKGLEDSY